MRSWLVFVLILFCCGGCRTSCPPIEPCIERRVAQVVQVAAFERPVHGETIPPVIPDQPNLADLWSLAIDANPSLRDAAAELEAARGRLLQSGLYLNPDVTYTQSGLGDSRNSAGTLNLVLRQEIITAGKRQLDISAAARGTEVAYLALVNRKFDVLGRIRRAFFDYVALAHVLDVNDEVVASLTLDTETTRKLVEEVESRPPADLVRMQALLEESKAVLVLSEATFAASWKQLAAEIGTPELRQPIQRPAFFEELPDLDEFLVSGRVLAANTELKQLSKQIEQARAQLARAEAAAVPNVTLGAGYQNNFPASQPGAIVTAQVPIPVWDRKQGLVRETQARLVQTSAILRSAETRLHRDTANAYGRYLGFKTQEDRLTRKVLPLFEQGLKAVKDLYSGGDPKRSFADVLLAQQNLNATKLRRAEVRRSLLQSYADLLALMQLDVEDSSERYTILEESPLPK